MNKAYAFAVLLILASFPALAQTGADDARIRIILGAQAAEWNRGNLDGYMVGYWESDSLIFIGKNGPTYGYRATLERYKKAYPDTARMGKLTSTVLSIRFLTPEWAYVTGRWGLRRSMGDLGGYFTLLFRKLNGEWVVVEDHSS